MAWPGVPSGTLPPPPLDMRIYEVMEHMRSMQIVQAEQSRRLDEQSYRIQQLEMKDVQTSRFESQRYLWGPGAVGSAPSRGLPGLGCEVFSPGKKKTVELPMESNMTHSTSENLQIDNPIETDIDNLLVSPTLSPKDTTIPEPPSRAECQSPANPSNMISYFPYVLAVQCWLGGRQDRPPTEADMVTAQINTSVHASFIDSALVHNLGVTHRIRNRRPARHQSPRTYSGPRILLPVYIPVDASLASTSAESQVAKVHIDFVVVSTHDMTPLDHQKLARLEIGSQALFLHGMDVLFSSRSLRISGLNIPMSRFAPRDQRRLLSTITAVQVNSQNSWDRLRRPKTEEHEASNVATGWTDESTLLRNTSTNSSISSTSANPTTAVTSPTLTEADPIKEHDSEPVIQGALPIAPTTAAPFSSALQFIPTSVMARPKPDDLPRSRSSTLQLEESHTTTTLEDTSRTRSNTLQMDSNSQPILHLESTKQLEPSKTPVLPLPELSPSLEVRSVPSRKSSLADPATPLSRKSSLAEHPSADIPEDIPRLPQNVMDKVVQRKASSTWPRALGKKVAPWTSMDATKTSILGNAFAEDPPAPAPRRMKILKPVRSIARVDGPGDEGGEVFNVNAGRDVKMDGKDKDDDHGKSQSAKNVGGGAFHWMK